MKYGFMPKMMWAGYKGTFKKELRETVYEKDPKGVMKRAHKKYKEIILGIDEFEKGDRFLIKILSCAMLAAVLLSATRKYSLEEVRVYYRKAMCGNLLTKIASKTSKSYTEKEGRSSKNKLGEAKRTSIPIPGDSPFEMAKR